MRRAAKRDDNHSEIVEALRKAGCLVLDLGAVGNGCPDLLVKKWGVVSMLEVKDGKKPPSARKLTPDQVEFHKQWGASVSVVSSIKDALRATGCVL